jgi:predicted transcriptional regulator
MDVNEEKITKALGKKYAITLLETTETPKTIHEITTQANIPQATCYRRIEELRRLGLLKEASEKTIVDTMDTRKTYIRCIDEIHIAFDSSTAKLTTSLTE